jgi:hypothetical protein
MVGFFHQPAYLSITCRNSEDAPLISNSIAMKRIFTTWLLFAITGILHAQTTLVSGTGAGGFESGTTFAANGWTEVNGAQTNKWYVGTAATGYAGARCAYVGTAATNNTYTISNSSVVHFYRDIAFPAGQPNITLAFRWKGYGESGYDRMRVFLVPVATALTAGTQLFSGQVGGDFNLNSNWQSASLSLPCTAAGTTMRLVFTWINDASIGTNPPAAIDNISVIASNSVACSATLGTGVFTVPSLPYTSPAGTTCGQGNDLTGTNTPLCGSTWYLDGEDQVWVFTLTLDAPSASYTGLTLYSGCPISTCSGPAATCVAYAQSSSGSKTFCTSVTAGTTYYLVLDSWPFPACNNYNSLSIVMTASVGCTALLGTGLTTVAALPYNSGAGTTCGMADNLTASNMVACGDASYLTGEDRVWTFMAPATGLVTISLTAPSASYTGLMLYSGCPVGNCAPGTGTCIDFIQDYTGNKTFCVSVVAGTTYYLVLDSWAFPVCNAYNNLYISGVTTAISGTICGNAISIPALPYTMIAQSTSCKANNYTAASSGICNGTYAFGEDIVYSYTATTAECIGISVTDATSNNISYAVYLGCPGGSGMCIGSGAFATTGSLSGSVTLPGAGTYYIIFDSSSPTYSYDFNLSITSFGSGAANDRPFQAFPIPFNVPTAGSNQCSGNADEPVAPACFISGGSINSVWYSFVAPASGCVKMRTSLGSLTNTQIALFGPVAGTIASGAGNTLAPVGCNDDQPACGYNTYANSELKLTGLVSGMTYYIMVDGYGGATGTFTLLLIDGGAGCLTEFPPTPGQDCFTPFPVCDASINVANPGPQAVGVNCDFTNGVNCLLSGERGSYWYQINIAANGFLEFDIIPNDWPGAPSTIATDYDFAVWKTTSAGTPGPATCSNLNTVPPVACNYSGLGVTGCFSAAVGNAPAAYPGFGAAYVSRIPVNAGDSYLLVVSNFSNSTSGFVLNISATAPIATTPPAGGTLVWTGSLSNDWFNAENWGGCTIPNCNYNVAIPAAVNMPAITGTTAACNDIDISLGANITLSANAQLKVCGSWYNNGVLTAANNSTVLMESTLTPQNQTMAGAMTGANRFWNVTINKLSTAGSNTVTLINDMESAGNFTLSSAVWPGATFNASGRHQKVGGNFNVHYSSVPYGNYVPAATLEFNGTGAQSYYNRGALNNVLMNHTGTGLTLGNSGVTDWMTIGTTGTLTLTNGKIMTGANRVNVANPAAAAVTQGNVNSYVEGFLMRSLAVPAGGSYDFPVGTSLRGYERINFNLSAPNDRSLLTTTFNNVAPAYPLLGPECISAVYDQPALNHGFWSVSTVPATGTSGVYDVTAYNRSYSNAMSGFTVITKNTAGAWGLHGNCVPTPVNAVQRTGLTLLENNVQFGIAQSATPLPVELIRFTATPLTDAIRLDWITASEINNSGFEIQRSVAPPAFEVIGWSDGQGTSSQMHEYLLTDHKIVKGQLYYYRLRQVDFDGNYNYSKIVSARISGTGITLAALPNPFSSGTQVLVSLSGDHAEAKLIVLDALGRVVKVLHEGALSAGTHVYDLQLQTGTPAQGVYTLRLIAGDAQVILKLVKQQ